MHVPSVVILSVSPVLVKKSTKSTVEDALSTSFSLSCVSASGIGVVVDCAASRIGSTDDHLKKQEGQQELLQTDSLVHP